MKVGVIGSGLVGSTAAYAMVMRGVGREIILVDLNVDRAQAEADDIFHAVPFSNPLDVHAGGYEDLANCRVVVISAGVNQRPGETRLDLLNRNAQVFRKVVPQVLAYSPEAILLIATNPVDVMTHLAAQYAGELGVASSRVIGTGTTLDTARFRTLLARHLGVDPHYVHAYVIGEHGDSEVLTWSLVTIGGMPLEDFCRLRKVSVYAEDIEKIDEQVRRAAYRIISGKGATYYGIGSAVARIVEVILGDQRAVLTVCTPVKEVLDVHNVTISLPQLIGGQGVITTLFPPINKEESEAILESAGIIQRAINSLEADEISGPG